MDGVTLMRSSLERESPDDGAGDVADIHRHKARTTAFGKRAPANQTRTPRALELVWLTDFGRCGLAPGLDCGVETELVRDQSVIEEEALRSCGTESPAQRTHDAIYDCF
jgi:hypothetical protein